MVTTQGVQVLLQDNGSRQSIYLMTLLPALRSLEVMRTSTPLLSLVPLASLSPSSIAFSLCILITFRQQALSLDG